MSHARVPVASDAEFDRLSAVMEELDVASDQRELSPEEGALRDLLEHLCSEYEERTAPIPDAPPLDVLHSLIRAHRLKQVDLVAEFGSASTVSAMLSGKRAIAKSHAIQLARRCPRTSFSASEPAPYGSGNVQMLKLLESIENTIRPCRTTGPMPV